MRLRIEQKKAITFNQRLMVTAIIKRGKKYLLVKRSVLHRVQKANGSSQRAASSSERSR